MTVRVLIADDQQLVRAGFRLILERQPGIEVVGEAASGAEAVRRSGRASRRQGRGRKVDGAARGRREILSEQGQIGRSRLTLRARSSALGKRRGRELRRVLGPRRAGMSHARVSGTELRA